MEQSPNTPRALLADADVGVRASLAAVFAEAGWTTSAVGSSAELFTLLQQTDFDLIVTAYCLPDVSGLELVRRLSREKPSQAVMVVATATTPGERIELLRSGAVDFIPAPIDSGYLLPVLDRLQRAQRAQERDITLDRGLVRDKAEFVLTSAQLAADPPHLHIIDRLAACSKIEMATKLRLELAFQEAITNSVEHGNLELKSEWKEEFDSAGVDRFFREKHSRLEDPIFCERRVWVSTSYRDQELRIVIRNEGPGFNPGIAIRLNDKAEVLRTFGRGLTLIVEIMDSVFFNAHGTEITMIKRIPHGA